MKVTALRTAIVAALPLFCLSAVAAEGPLAMKKGQGGSEIQGSAGPGGSQGDNGLEHCDKPMGAMAVVEPADGSVVKVLSETLHNGDAIAVVAEMVTDLSTEDSGAEGLFVVGSGTTPSAPAPAACTAAPARSGSPRRTRWSSTPRRATARASPPPRRAADDCARPSRAIDAP